MIQNLAEKITNSLINKSIISFDEKELYQYGFFNLISQTIYVILIILFGLIIGEIISSLIFYIAFYFIRKNAGGYHAKTETRCEIMSIISLLLCIIVIKLLLIKDVNLALLFLSMAAFIIIFVLCPLDTPEKPLSKNEFRYFRKISRLILLIISALILISFIFEWKLLFAPLCISLMLECILLIAGKVKKVYQLKNAE